MRYLLLILLIPALGFAQYGPNNPATQANNTAVGTTAWTNPNNIQTANNSYATVSTLNTTSQYVQGTNFGFNLLNTDVVAGIKVDIEKSSTASNVALLSPSWTIGTASGFAVTRPAGTNRILLVVIGIENSTAPRNVNAVTYGGQALTSAGEIDQATPFYARTEVWYLLETQIAAASGTNLTYTFASGSLAIENFEIIGAAFYNNVDQTSPLIDVEVGGTASTASTYQLPTAMVTNEGSMSVMGIFSGAPPSTGAIGNVNGFTVNQGYTERMDYHSANASFSTSGGVLMVADLASAVVLPATGTTQPTFTFNGSPNRRTVVGISLRRMRDQDNSVRIRKSTGFVGTEKATTGDWSTTDLITTYGSSSDLWGTSWTFAEINNTNFGAAMSGTLRNGTLQVDHMKITVYTTSVLPLDLISFDAKQTGASVGCNWVTASERNTDKFLVERSSDGIHFQVVGAVKAAGNSESILLYEFKDENPAAGINYYRLKMTDNDGSFTNSDIVSVNYNRENVATIYPNPANEWATVMTANGFDEIIITDAQGHIVDRFAGTTMQTKQDLNIEKMPDGAYFVCIKSMNGTVEIQKLMKTSRTL